MMQGSYTENCYVPMQLLHLLANVVRPSVCLSVVCRLSVTFVHPTQVIEIFGHISTPFNTMVI